MRPALIALAVALTSVSVGARAQDAGTAGAHAQDAGAAVVAAAAEPVVEDRARQTALVREADRAERDARPADAVALWREARAAAPTSRVAGRCETRIAYLTGRSEGGYAPLADLMRMRKLPTSALSAAVLDGYARRLDAYPAGHARREGRELVADAWLGRLGDASRARRAYEQWLAEPGVEDVERRLAASGLARAHTQLGDPGAALRAMQQAGLGASTDADELRVEARRRVLRVVAWLLITVFLGGGLALGGYRGLHLVRLRRALGPARIAAAIWVLGGPLLIASLFDDAAIDTFATLALAGAAVLLAAAVFGAGFGDARPARRRVVAIGAFTAMLGAGFLVLDGAGFLLSLGL